MNKKKTSSRTQPLAEPERLFYDAVLRCMQFFFCYKTVDRKTKEMVEERLSRVVFPEEGRRDA